MPAQRLFLPGRGRLHQRPRPTSFSTSVAQVWVQCELGNHYRVYVQPRPNNLHTYTGWTPKPDVRIRSADSAGVCPAFDGS